MRLCLKHAKVFTNDGFVVKDLFVDRGRIVSSLSFDSFKDGRIVDCTNCYIVPGLVDVHVHLREPGFLYKEDIESGTKAAAAGGYSVVCSMPNVNPVPDCMENLNVQLEAIQEKAVVKVIPYGSISKGRVGRGSLSSMEEMSRYVAGYSDDGCGVQSEDVMKQAMMEAKRLDKIIVAHCEDESELKAGGCIHDGMFARSHGYVGINSASEYKQVMRDLELVKEIGCKYHVCHVSTKESVEAIRKAKLDGVKVTCETCPHYLIYTEEDLEEDGKWKMNPPLRSKEDRKALIEGILDGTIDCLVTDHAPHSEEEKNKGLDGSAFGIVGLETAFAAMYTNLVCSGVMSLEKLVEVMGLNPRRIFGIEGPRSLDVGEIADLCVLNLEKEWVVDPSRFYSKGKSTLFEGKKLQGCVVMNVVDGNIVYEEGMKECKS